MALHSIPVAASGKIDGTTVDTETMVDGVTKKLFTQAERTKLSSVATNATANSTDAQLLDRANHTGVQAASTITSGVFAAARIPDLSSKYVALGPASVCGEYQVVAQTGGGTDTGVNAMLKRVLPSGVGLELVRARFTNSGAASNGDVDGANVFTVHCSLGLTTTGPWFAMSLNGSRDIVINPGFVVDTDPMAFHVATGGTFYIKTFLSVTSGQFWWAQPPAAVLGTEYWVSKSAGEADLSISTAAFTATTGAFAYLPSAIIEQRAPRTRASVALIGDSIAGGIGESNGYGYMYRAVNGILPYQRIAVSGSRLRDIIDPNVGRRRLVLIRDCNIAVDEYGTNDIHATPFYSLATIQGWKIQFWTMLSNMGMKVFTNTLTPVSTSTDSWATSGNQTASIYNAVRTGLNDWIRDGAPILAGVAVAVGSSAVGTLRAGATGHPLLNYFEVADIGETARNSGIWKSDGTAGKWTADGTHPSAYGHTQLAAGISTAVIVTAAAS